MFPKVLKAARRILIFSFLGWFILSFALGVFLGEGKSFQFDQLYPSMTSSDQLYFKNVRSFYYGSTSNEAGGFEKYKLKSLLQDTGSNSFTPTIIKNWRTNEAFLVFDQKQAGKIEIHTAKGDSTFVLSSQNVYLHAQVAAYIFDNQKDIVELKISKCPSCPLETLEPSKLKQYRIVLKDYFRLIGWR